MKKDYTLSPEGSKGDEIDFIRVFWTRRWDGAADLGMAETLSGREEYQIIGPFLSKIPQGGRVLDGGCGLGEWTAFFNSLGYETIGMDISATTIARLSQRFPDCSFACADIRDTGFENSSFDAYFSWGVFEHFELGPARCIEEAYRILKPGGLLFLTVPFQNWRHILREAASGFSWKEAFEHVKTDDLRRLRFYQWRFTKADLRQELEMRRFRILESKPIHRREGWKRCLTWDFKLREGTKVFRLADRLLHRLVPRGVICHMLMVVARKEC